MKNNNLLIKWLFAFLVLTNIVGCDDDDHPIPNEITLKDSYSIIRSTVLSIKPEVTGYENASYKWYLTETPKGAADSLLNETSELTFIALETGNYKLKLEVTEDDNMESFPVQLVVEKEEKDFSPYISEVIDYLPGVGQFVNELPKYEDGDTKEIMIKKAGEYLVGEAGSLVTLGGFGGYVTFRFDHTVANLPGVRDFRVKGNAFLAAANPRPNAPWGGSCEPGVIRVAYDKNKNNKPDADEWYEIAGSSHEEVTKEPWYDFGVKNGNDMKFIRQFEITYYRPKEEPEQPIDEYIRWEDNQGNSGYKVKNMFHKQSYFPAWIDGDSYTLSGTRLPQNGIDESGMGNYFVCYGFRYGYVDNYPNNHDNSGIDIAWAVDADGKQVHLPGIDFVSVYCGVNQENGWLGECSTEVSGAEDLHLLGKSITTIDR
ncbi:MAG: hypothetical protein N4A59_15515 [Marinifilum sp.]|jgi:hypothetical protein|nr:hypothetical protein [Marinifilum sp.]